MMKKGILFTAAASVLCLASCSQDDFAPVQDASDNGNVTFTVSLNDKPATRAFGDGSAATELEYAVYDVTDGGADLAGSGKTTFVNGSLTTTVSLSLVTGRDYKVAFFATRDQNGTNKVYTFNANAKTVKVDYKYTEQTFKQDRDNDCFYKMHEIKKADLGKSHTVLLTRPVAQINFATADIDTDAVKAAFDGKVRTKVSGKGYTVLNLLDGTVDGLQDFTTEVAAEPISPEHTESPVEGLAYLHCTYVLVPRDEKVVSDVTLNVFKGGIGEEVTPMFDVNVSNVPLQANYRTNIYGNLLTKQNDVTVVKDNNWTGTYDVDVWKGEIADDLPTISEDNVMSITSVAQLAKVAQDVNNGNSLKGVTIKLTKDLNLNNYNWTPIGEGVYKGQANKPFEGSFDGQGHTIYNLSIDKTDNKAATGFFGYVTDSPGLKNVKFDGVSINVREAVNVEGVGSLVGHAFKTPISDISVKNVDIQAYHWSGGVVGYIYGNLDDCYAENVTIDIVVDPTVDNGDKAGAIAGYCAESGSGCYTTNNNSAKNVRISGFRDLGGLFGMMQYTRSMANNTISDVKITINTENGSTILSDIDNIGAIVGRWGYKNGYAIVGENNTFENYTFIGKDKEEIFTESGTLTQETPKAPQNLYPKSETSL